mmetsp:Transcript_85558/g.261678  ORF Transcript_85558/g.261678 Transcript_85558/m.261678 type:complete len:270 (-) Transcript_85558:1635-2444(-)
MIHIHPELVADAALVVANGAEPDPDAVGVPSTHATLPDPTVQLVHGLLGVVGSLGPHMRDEHIGGTVMRMDLSVRGVHDCRLGLDDAAARMVHIELVVGVLGATVRVGTVQRRGLDHAAEELQKFADGDAAERMRRRPLEHDGSVVALRQPRVALRRAVVGRREQLPRGGAVVRDAALAVSQRGLPHPILGLDHDGRRFGGDLLPGLSRLVVVDDCELQLVIPKGLYPGKRPRLQRQRTPPVRRRAGSTPRPGDGLGPRQRPREPRGRA